MVNTQPTKIHPVTDRKAAPVQKESEVRAAHYRGEELLKVSRNSGINPRLVCLLQPGSATAESYYRLRHAVENMHQPQRGTVVGVTSPGAGEGKTLTAINLAGALAQDSAASVLLVDLDLRQSGANVRNYLGLKTPSGPGVVDWILNTELNREQATYYIPDFNLYLMPSGAKSELPYELLKSSRLDDLFAQARQRYDFVVLDTTQVLFLPDTQLISRLIDGFLVVLKANDTSQKMLEETLNLMTQDKVLGLVFNGNTSFD